MNSDLQRLRDAITSATEGMSEDDLRRQPASGKWSPCEILEHLTLTYRGTIKNLERSLDAEKPLGGTPALKQRFRTMLVTGLGYFPTGRESPKGALPRGAPPERVRGEIETALAQMDDVIRRCETKFGRNALVAAHPVLGPITMRQWCKFHWVHGKHHLNQISRMRNRG